MATTGAIELIPQEIEAVKARTVLTRRIQFITFLIFLIAVGISGALFFFKQSLASDLEALQSQSANLEATIGEYSDIETKVVGLESRVSLIGQIIITRDNFSGVFAAEEASRPADLSVTGMSMTKDELTVTINGTVAEYDVLSEFLNNLVDPEKGGILFTQAALTSVNLDSATGEINFTAEITIKAGGVKESLTQ